MKIVPEHLKKIILAAVIPLILTSCITGKKVVHEKVPQPERIIILVSPDKDSLINNSYLPDTFFDASADQIADTVMPITDVTADLTNDTVPDLTSDAEKKKLERIYITNPRIIEYYKNLFEKLRESMEKTFFYELKKRNVTIELYRSLSEILNPTDLVYDIKIRNYQVGEFNLIKNRDTEMFYEVIVTDGTKKLIANFSKNYIVKTDYLMPLEFVRLQEVNRLFVTDFLQFSKGFLKLNTATSKSSEEDPE